MSQIPVEQNEQIRQQCIFCQIVDGKVAAKKIYEDDKVLAVLDINPANLGHILLLPKEHISIMPQMNEDLTNHIAIITKQLSQVLLRALQVQGTTIFAANGSVAGQRAPHFMIHIIPRTEEDNIGIIPVLKKQSKEDILQIHHAIYEAIKKVLGTAIPSTEKPEKKLEVKEKEIQQNSGGTDPKLDAISNLLTK